MNERYELAAARRKEKREIAASLLKEGIPTETIAKCTGLSADEIKRLRKKTVS
jgi:hypothetical protein